MASPNTEKCNSVLVKKALVVALKAGLVSMLVGSPGIGKSDIINGIANEHNWAVIDLRLAQCDPTDLNGFPNVNQKTNRAGYLPFETFPVMGDKLPPGKNGWLIFMDEFNSGDRDVQKAAYKLILDRKVGKFDLHQNVVIICAGNLETDNAIVEEMSSALQSRLVHLELTLDYNAWLDWASQNALDPRIMAYIRSNPKMLSSFDPDAEGGQRTYACPRTWHFASKLLEHMEITDPVARPLLSGALSEGPAREFITWLRIYKDLPEKDTIINSPATALIPNSTGGIYAISGSISKWADSSNITPIMKYLARLPMEYQVMCLTDMSHRTPALLHSPPVANWIAVNNSDLF